MNKKLETKEYNELKENISKALNEINTLSNSINIINEDDEYKYAYEITELINSLEVQIKKMNYHWDKWYQIKNKKGDIK